MVCPFGAELHATYSSGYACWGPCDFMLRVEPLIIANIKINGADLGYKED
jgi:hypothetical protein